MPPVLPLLAGLLVAYILLPIAVFLLKLPGAGAVPPGLLGPAILTSAAAATLAAVVDAALGIPLGHLLARGRLPRAVGIIAQMPIALPPIISGFLLVAVFGAYGPVGSLLNAVGLLPVGTLAGMVLAQVFVSSPFVVIGAEGAFRAVPPSVEAVARTLGASPWRTFLAVSIPAAGPALLAGCLLGWLRAFGEFGATMILAYHPYGLPVLSFVLFDGFGLPAVLPVIGVTLAFAAAFLTAAGIVMRSRPAPHLPQVRPAALPAFRQARRPVLSLTSRITAVQGSFRLDAGLDVSGRTIALFGPSGAGKSVTLRHLAGIEGPLPEDIRRLTGNRPIGYVPQDAGLFPHLTALENVAFGLAPGEGREGRAADLLALAGVAHRQGSLPVSLSGGERQRVALARAMAVLPSLFLLDEPLSAVDAPERRRLRQVIQALVEEAGAALVIVSHDPVEVRLLADATVVIEDGRVIAQGPTEDLFANPPTPSVARLVGAANVLDLEAVGKDLCVAGVPVAPAGGRLGAVPCHFPAAAVRAAPPALPGAIPVVRHLPAPAVGEWSVEVAGGVVLTGEGPLPDRAVRLDEGMIRLFGEGGGPMAP